MLAQEYPMDKHEPYQLDGTAPELYERYLVPTVTAPWAADLVAAADLRPGESVLDVACGTGVVARLAAARVHGGRVAGLDLNAGMLAVARSIPAAAGAPIEWHEASALDLPFPDTTFDHVLCQFGLMFFPDRSAALQEMRRVLRPGGRLALNVYGPLGHNPAAQALAGALDHYLGHLASAPKRAEHALADAGELSRLVVEAGFRDVTIRTATLRVRFATPREWVQIQLTATAQAGLVGGMEQGQWSALVDAIAAEVAAAVPSTAGEEDWSFPQQAHVLLARA
jgi:ubiquinone/menaquinone biosynthesis C-methylase UbiE